jgi:uncharacterized protein YigA (DUF484 family)
VKESIQVDFDLADSHFLLDKERIKHLPSGLLALLATAKIQTTLLRESEYSAMFEQIELQQDVSAAIVPLRLLNQTILGYWIIVSDDVTHFEADQGTVFLEFAAELVIEKMRSLYKK